MWLATVAFLMMLTLIVLLLMNKVSTLFAFSIIPIFAAILVGTSIKNIGIYVGKGLLLTSPVAWTMTFSLPFFMVLQDAGMFNGIVRRLLKHIKLNPIIISIMTLVVSIVSGLGASMTAQYLVTIPLMLPFYRKFKMSPLNLMTVTSLGCIWCYNLPWSARSLRAASLLPNIPNANVALYARELPATIALLIAMILFALWWGIQDKRKAIKEYGKDVYSKLDSSANIINMKGDDTLVRPKLFWVNILLTIIVIGAMILLNSWPTYYVFAIGLIVALMINYPNLKLQNKLLKKYASSLFPTMPVILLSGVVVGIMQYTGMMKAMVNVLFGFIPASVGPWVYLIVGLLATPLLFLFTNDTWYYVLIPVVMSLSAKYGIPGIAVVGMLFMNMGIQVDPLTPHLYLALDLTHENYTIGDYMKKAFIPVWICGIVWVLSGFIFGAFR